MKLEENWKKSTTTTTTNNNNNNNNGNMIINNGSQNEKEYWRQLCLFLEACFCLSLQ
jgi:hypothetical protein